MKHRFLYAVLPLAMTACASMHATPNKDVSKAKQGKVAAKASPPVHALPLQQMEPGFLYLAAQGALQNNQPELAVRFLSALVAKRPSAIGPRMELASLYMQLNQPEKALKEVKSARSSPGLSKEDKEKLDMLHARILFSNGQIDEAIEDLSKLVSARPNLLPARQVLAQWLAGTGQIREALSIVQEGIRHKDNPELRLLEAQLYMHEKNFSKARNALLHLRKLEPDTNTAVLMLSAIEIQQHHLKNAEAILRKYLIKHRDDLQVGNMLGRLLVQQGRIKDAIHIYEHISHKTGEQPEVAIALGLLYFQQQNYAAASQQFKIALDKEPNNQTHYYLGLSLEGEKKDKLALEQYVKVAPKSAMYSDAQLRIAAIEFRQKKDNEAIKRTKEVITDHPDNIDAYLLLSIFRLTRNEFRLLLDETSPAMKLKAIPPRLLFNRAVAFDHFKQYGKLDKSLRTLLRIKPNDSEALNFLGYSLAERGMNLNEAEKLIKRALKIKPNDGYYLDSLAWTYFKQGKYAKAIKVQTRAVSIIKKDPVMHEHLGDMYWKDGNHAKARAMWKAAIRMKHKDPAKLRRKIKVGI